jgi:phosphoribosyl-AMP cyclohydrolase
MLAWMNDQSLRLTLETGEAHYWSRSRGELWRKGATSGQLQAVEGVRLDCDGDAVLLRVRPAGDGGACHLGERSCFHRRLELSPQGDWKLTKLDCERRPDTPPPLGILNMRTVFCALLAAALFVPVAAGAQGKQDFTLHNKTGYTISEVYVSAANTDDWEEDVLGDDVLNSGQRSDQLPPRPESLQARSQSRLRRRRGSRMGRLRPLHGLHDRPAIQPQHGRHLGRPGLSASM